MAILKIKDETGKFVDIPAIQGAPGKDGAIQYEAGENITIDGNVISASGGITLDDVKIITGELTNLSTEDKSSLVNAINEAMNNGGITELTGDIIINDLAPGLYTIHGNYTIFYRNNIQADKFSSVYSDMNNRILIVGSGDYSGSMYPYGILLDGSYIKVFRADLCRKYELMYSNILTLNNTNSYTPTSDYNPATKKYVDDNKSKVPTFISASLPEYSASDNTSPSITNETELASLSDIINNFYKEGIASASLFVGNSNNTSSAILFSRGQVLNAKVETYKFWGIMPGWDSSTLRLGISLVVKGTWTDNAFTCTSAYFQTGIKYQLNSFAQKSYVDNAIANAITTSLEASY